MLRPRNPVSSALFLTQSNKGFFPPTSFPLSSSLSTLVPKLLGLPRQLKSFIPLGCRSFLLLSSGGHETALKKDEHFLHTFTYSSFPFFSLRGKNEWSWEKTARNGHVKIRGIKVLLLIFQRTFKGFCRREGLWRGKNQAAAFTKVTIAAFWRHCRLLLWKNARTAALEEKPDPFNSPDCYPAFSSALSRGILSTSCVLPLDSRAPEGLRYEVSPSHETMAQWEATHC